MRSFRLPAIVALVATLGLLLGSSSASYASIPGGRFSRELMQAAGGFPYPDTCIVPARHADASPYSLTLYSAAVGKDQSEFCFIITDSTNPSFFSSGQAGACKRQILNSLYQILIAISPNCQDHILGMTVNGETRNTWSLAYDNTLLETGDLGLTPGVSAVGTIICFTTSAPCHSLPNLLNSRVAKISYAMTESAGNYCCPGETKSAALSTLPPRGPFRTPPMPPPPYPGSVAPGGSSPPVYPINAPGGSSPPVYPINAPGGSSPPVYPINAPGGSSPPVYPINAPGSEDPPVYPIKAPGSNAPDFITVPLDRLPDFDADTARVLSVTYSILGTQTFLTLSSSSKWAQLKADLIDAIAYATSLDTSQVWILDGYPQSDNDGKSMIVKYAMQANGKSQVILVDFLLYFVSYHPDRAFPTEQAQTWGIEATSAAQSAFPVWSLNTELPPQPPMAFPSPPASRRS